MWLSNITLAEPRAPSLNYGVLEDKDEHASMRMTHDWGTNLSTNIVYNIPCTQYGNGEHKALLTLTNI